uniref:Uncharacterized protein n=1 Tax=Arundo donax TaxID=35708 RepID=A0A0A9CY03_ARUDO
MISTSRGSPRAEASSGCCTRCLAVTPMRTGECRGQGRAGARRFWSCAWPKSART